MARKVVRLTSDDGRWLELAVDRDAAFATVGGSKSVSEPFPFSFENLGYVPFGMGYQAWGGGSHFIFRKSEHGYVVEFQAEGDRSAAVCYLDEWSLSTSIRNLDEMIEPGTSASMF